jgi:hypothetical protein
VVSFTSRSMARPLGDDSPTGEPPNPAKRPTLSSLPRPIEQCRRPSRDRGDVSGESLASWTLRSRRPRTLATRSETRIPNESDSR